MIFMHQNLKSSTILELICISEMIPPPPPPPPPEHSEVSSWHGYIADSITLQSENIVETLH